MVTTTDAVHAEKNTCNAPELLARLLTPIHIKHLWSLRQMNHESTGALEVCDSVCFMFADNVNGFVVIEGDYHDGTESAPYHCWLLFPCGTIVDPTADQFGLDGITVVPPTAETYAHYRDGSVREA